MENDKTFTIRPLQWEECDHETIEGKGPDRSVFFELLRTCGGKFQLCSLLPGIPSLVFSEQDAAFGYAEENYKVFVNNLIMTHTL